MPEKSLRVVHTSDWHIGKKLYNMDRYEEFEAFLAWLLEAIDEESADALLVCGDVFDTGAPANMAQRIYYQFLSDLSKTGCRHIVITAGNHDSPTFLEAPRNLLHALNIHVLGIPAQSPADEVLLLRDSCNEPELVICATPYLREKDVRRMEVGESIEDKEAKLAQGIAARYHETAEACAALCAGLQDRIPVIAMGHLFVGGSSVQPGDGSRNLYIGALGQVGMDIFSDIFDYVALGHIHSAQKFGKNGQIRYCGSPLPMSFGEKKKKCLNLLEFRGNEFSVRELDIPVFRELESIRGEWPDIRGRLEALAKEVKAGRKSPWIEVVYDGKEALGDNLARLVDEIALGSGLEILCKRDERKFETSLADEEMPASLDQISVEDIFIRCLNKKKIPEARHAEYLQTFREIVDSLHIQGQ